MKKLINIVLFLSAVSCGTVSAPPKVSLAPSEIAYRIANQDLHLMSDIKAATGIVIDETRQTYSRLPTRAEIDKARESIEAQRERDEAFEEARKRNFRRKPRYVAPTSRPSSGTR